MARISGFATDHGFDRIPELKNLDMSSTGAVSSAAVDLADKLNAKAIVATPRPAPPCTASPVNVRPTRSTA